MRQAFFRKHEGEKAKKYMINLQFDVTTLLRSNLTGIGVYALQLLAELQKHNGLQVMPVYKPSRIHKKKFLKQHINLNNRAGMYLPHIHKKKSIFHGPDFKLFCEKNRLKTITIHDMAYYSGLLSPEFSEWGKQLIKSTLAKEPGRIITVSQFSKQCIADIYPEYYDRIDVIYHGAEHLSAAIPEEKIDRARPEKPFILFVGNLEYRKNVHTIIDAFEILKEKFHDLNLVLVGADGYRADLIKAKISESPYKSSIHRPGYLDNASLRALYVSAICFVYPSLYEGFGIPIIEAMTAGTAVVTSNIGAMKEVSGNAALHADPHSPEDIAHQIKKLIESEQLRKAYIAKGKKHIMKFSWQKTAEQTVAVYQKILADS